MVVLVEPILAVAAASLDIGGAADGGCPLIEPSQALTDCSVSKSDVAAFEFKVLLEQSGDGSFGPGGRGNGVRGSISVLVRQFIFLRRSTHDIL